MLQILREAEADNPLAVASSEETELAPKVALLERQLAHAKEKNLKVGTEALETGLLRAQKLLREIVEKRLAERRKRSAKVIELRRIIRCLGNLDW